MREKRDNPTSSATFNVPNRNEDGSITENPNGLGNSNGMSIVNSLGIGGGMGGGGIRGNYFTSTYGNVDDDTMSITLNTLGGTTTVNPSGANGNGGLALALTEQDVYAAADSLEIIRDAHVYFGTDMRSHWKASRSARTGLENLHQLGVDAMCTLSKCHLLNAGPGIRLKRAWALKRGAGGGGGGGTVTGGGNNNDDASTIATNITFGTRATAMGNGMNLNPHAVETARDTRERLTAALQNRDLMKSVGEYEESLPLDTRTVRELRAIFECMGGDGCFLHNATGNNASASASAAATAQEIMKKLQQYQVAAGKVQRTEKIGSGHYTKITKKALDCGYPHLDAYSEARRSVAFLSMQMFYKTLRAARKKEWEKRAATTASSGGVGYGNYGTNVDAETGELDSAARDAVRCLEHAMVIVAGEKSIYRCVVSPTSSHTHDSSKIPLEYKYALVASYSHVCSVVVDRVLDIIELFFIKDAALRNTPRNPVPISSSHSGSMSSIAGGISSSRASNGVLGDGDSIADGADGAVNTLSVRFAASAAAAGLRILDAVRLLGPSLAKLCEMASDKMKLRQELRQASSGSMNSRDSTSSLASNLCIAIHRMTVKNTGKALENLALAVKHDPLDGAKYRPPDTRVAAVSSDVVRAIRIVSPFVNAYKSVTKRRPLTWDPKIGEAAGEMDYFIRFLVMSLLNNLNAKAAKYTKEPGPVSQAKSYLFLMNNTFYLSEQLGVTPSDDNNKSDTNAPISTAILRNKQDEDNDVEGGDYKITGAWFMDQVGKLFANSKKKYLQNWEVLNEHLTRVSESDLNYSNAEQKLLTLDSGRLLKARFSGFNESFEKTYATHKELTIIDRNLRARLLDDVKTVFLPRYKKFYTNYSKYQFSKKNMEDYLKYPPAKIEKMMADMFSSY